MTAETDLLPLPSSLDSWFVQKMEDYARANVAHATSAKDAEIERLRSILIDLKDWDCDVSGGFLSIPVALRRRMQEAIDAHPQPASDVARLAEALREAADDLERGIDARIVVAQLRARADLLRDQEEGNE